MWRFTACFCGTLFIVCFYSIRWWGCIFCSMITMEHVSVMVHNIYYVRCEEWNVYTTLGGSFDRDILWPLLHIERFGRARRWLVAAQKFAANFFSFWGCVISQLHFFFVAANVSNTAIQQNSSDHLLFAEVPLHWAAFRSSWQAVCKSTLSEKSTLSPLLQVSNTVYHGRAAILKVSI